MSKKPFKTKILTAVAVMAILAGSIGIADAQRTRTPPPSNAPTPAPNPSAVLNHLNIPNPLDLAADILGLDFAQLFRGGEQAMNNWFRNWNDILHPAEKDATAQEQTAKIDRTRNYGTAIDAQNAAEAQMDQELNEYDERAGGISETACVVSTGITGGSGSGGNGNGGGTGQGGLSSGFQISTAVTRALGEKMSKDALNSKGSPSEFGPSADYGYRWDIYSKHFCDPQMNGGQAGCAPQGQQLPNADISIESFLLKDTIDLSVEEEKLAAYAILRNLVQPNVGNLVSQGDMEGYSGKNATIKKRELQSLRNMPVSVVSSIIGRRASIPDSNVSQTIRPLRERAGVDARHISDKASFNEIMLALTKERFYNPEYFATISSSTEEQIAQEQMGVDVLTQITLRQIHLLQEQMGGLLAARASIKHNGDNFQNAALKYGSTGSSTTAPASSP